MSAPVFVDTNVLIYARDRGEPAKQPRASEWLKHLWHERAGRTSVQVLSEYYVNVTRKLDPGLSREEAWDDVNALLAWRPQVIDSGLLQRAREIEQRYRLSWWDSLVVAAAQCQGCALLLSEDFQDGAVYGDVTIRSPFTLSLGEEVAAYVAARSVAPARRPRGRPKGSTRRTRA
ncbi:MAG: PIN domain-containing protein [Burkholderiales bacterium]